MQQHPVNGKQPFVVLVIDTILVDKGNQSQWGAISGMLTGLTFTLGYIIYFKGVFFEPFAANIPKNWILGISPEGAGVIGMALNFIVATIVARNTAPPPAHIQQLVEDIRVPK